MKLLYVGSTFEFEVLEDKATYIAVEDKRLFRSMVADFEQQTSGAEGFWILKHNCKALKMDKSLHLIMNPLHVDINSKSILTKLQNALVKDADTMVLEYLEVQNLIQKFLTDLEFGYPLEITHKMEISIADLVKLGSFHFIEDSKDQIDTLLTYMEVVRELLKVDVFVLVNIDIVLDDEELELFIKTALARKLTLVCLTTSQLQEIHIDKSLINGYTVDKDFCLF